ncbi:hypothetical protein IFR05_003654 [Cadophora sp. M221]|nr:hypothetical protein IFR05_003654 [Cadophora sp. M221]
MKSFSSLFYFLLPGISLSAALVAPQPSAECVAATNGGPLQVTADCIDPLYASAVIENERDQTSPSTHRLVSGYFNGTGLTFNIYLPPKEQFGNRFFQWVYPLQNDDANSVVPDTVAFCFDSKAYIVQVTGTTSGYRGDAAGAKLSRKIAAKYYNLPSTRHIYGYVYGGSGGSLVTVGAIENTKGIWEGAVPIVQAIPISVPNNNAARALAALVLRNQTASIEDALLPGGSGDPYSKLNRVQRAALLEATKFGIALQAWQDFGPLESTSTLAALTGVVQGLDPTYQNDFWTKQGYLGTEVSELGDIIRAAKFEYSAIIQKVVRDPQDNPLSFTLEAVPANLPTVGLDYNLYSSDDQLIGLLRGTLDSSSRILTLAAGNSNVSLSAIASGLKLRIDNRWFIAVHAYYRYQVPSRAGYYGFDQFRNSNGQPIYPQRQIEVGPIVARSSSGGGTNTGAINTKVIQVDNLFDVDAYPWHADWYKSQVQASLGSRFNDNYRIWYNDHSNHFFEQLPKEQTNYLVQYTGVYHQALRDLVDWVENGKEPPPSTRYTVKDSQIVVSASAKDRLGVQPVAQLRVSGQNRTTVRAGKTVIFEANIEVPPGTGKIVKAEWDFYGTGDFVDAGFGSPRDKAVITGKFSYPRPGTYFAGLRVTSKRNPKNAFAGIMNMDRVRVVVI